MGSRFLFCIFINVYLLVNGNENRENPLMTHYFTKEITHDSNAGTSDRKSVPLGFADPGLHYSEQPHRTTNYSDAILETTLGSHPTNTIDERLSDLISTRVFEFGRNIGQILGESNYASKSEVFSPLSAMSAIALLMLGARANTYEQLYSLFGLDYNYNSHVEPTKFHEEFAAMINDLQLRDLTSSLRRSNAPWRNTSVRSETRSKGQIHWDEHIIKVANGLFTQTDYSLNINYREVVESVYHSDLIKLDFNRNNANAQMEINNWVASKTLGKIPNIISDEIPKNTKMIICNALYFKAIWENSFFEKATALDDFYPDGLHQRSVKVNMMVTGGVFPSYDAQEFDCRILGLPYKGNVTTMYIIQPNGSTRAKLKEFQKNLTSDQVEAMINKMTKKSTVLALPKMSTVRSINLKTILNRLGIVSLFQNGVSDLSLISSDQKDDRPVFAGYFKETKPVQANYDNTNAGGKRRKRNVYNQALRNLENQRSLDRNAGSDLFVHDILHKVNFEVNEYGTEAAAATLTYLRRSGPEVLFRAETPFIVLIRHDPTKLILFYGIINEPELSISS